MAVHRSTFRENLHREYIFNSPLSSHLIPIVDDPKRNHEGEVPNFKNSEAKQKDAQVPQVLHNKIILMQRKSLHQVRKRISIMTDQIVS